MPVYRRCPGHPPPAASTSSTVCGLLSSGCRAALASAACRIRMQDRLRQLLRLRAAHLRSHPAVHQGRHLALLGVQAVGGGRLQQGAAAASGIGMPTGPGTLPTIPMQQPLVSCAPCSPPPALPTQAGRPRPGPGSVSPSPAPPLPGLPWGWCGPASAPPPGAPAPAPPPSAPCWRCCRDPAQPQPASRPTEYATVYAVDALLTPI